MRTIFTENDIKKMVASYLLSMIDDFNIRNLSVFVNSRGFIEATYNYDNLKIQVRKDEERPMPPFGYTEREGMDENV